MVAVISGNGLGLGNTSLTQLGQGQGGSPKLGQAANGSYVNAATGNLVLQSADEGLLFDGLPLNVLRTYNSLGQLNGNGGWSYGFSRNLNGLTGTLNTAGSTITRTGDDGSSVVYTYNATLGVYESTDQSGAVDTLSWNATASTWTWTDAADNTQETYSATGHLTALTDTATGASYSFSYSNSQLSQIVAGDGDTLLFGYNTSNQLISLSIQEVPPGQAMAVTRQAVTYGYDSQGRLSTVTTTLASDTDSSAAASYTTTYAYQGTTDLVATVTQSDGTTVSYTYTEDAQGAYQVTEVTTGTGAAAQSVTLSYGTDGTTVTDGLGNATQYQYNAAGELTAVIAPVVNGVSPTTSYTYDANGNLLTSTDPDGAVTTYQYDGNGNLLSVEDGAGNTVSYTYNANDQVTSKTTYTVPAQGEVGQGDYVAPSGAQTSYYVYNGNDQLAYTIDPLGDVSENDYTLVNGLSELATSRQYLGVTYSVDSNGNSPSAPPTLLQLQAWVQSSAVQGALGQSTRTDYTYDVRGQLATQTQYDTVDANGNGVLTNGTVITTATYDAKGKLLQTSTETGASRSTLQTTSYAYDGLGRVISKTDPLGNVTTYVYTDNGSNDTLAITQANGLITTQVRNSAGLLVSSTQSGTGQVAETSSYLYNADGEQIATIDPLGNVTYTFYNADGKVTGTVDGDGNVTAYTYDADGRVLSTRQYANTVNTRTWIHSGKLTTKLPSSLPVPASNAADSTTTSIYDAAGNAVATISATNDVTITTYDGAGNAVVITRYATALTGAQRTALGTAPTLAALQADITASVKDETTRTIYDADNRAVAVIDPKGIVSTVTYDGAGDIVASRTYATVLLTAAQIAALGNAPTLAALLSGLGSSAQTIYNANNQPVATISANGDVKITTYDDSGNAVASTQYATPLTAAQLAALGSEPTLAVLQADITPSAGDLTTLTVYNTSNQPVATVSSSGGVTITTYDSNGNAIASTQYATPLTAAQLVALADAPTLAAVQGDITPSAGDLTTLTVYNAGNQPVATVSPGGGVTITTYDSNGNAVTVTQYATPLTASQLAALGNAPTLAAVQADLTPSANDLTTLTIYNASNQVVATISPNGDVTATTYDDDGNVIASVTYATPLTAAQLAALGTTPTLAELQAVFALSTSDVINLRVYNANEQVVATVSSSGVVVVTSYDAAGNVSSTTQYANELSYAQIVALGTAPTLSAVTADLSPSSSDQTTVTIYDANEHPVATVSGQMAYGYYDNYFNYGSYYDSNATLTSYDASGNTTYVANYSLTLSYSQVTALAEAPSITALQADLGNAVPTSSTITIYDANERPVAVATVNTYYDPYYAEGYYIDGYVDLTTYDAAGNVTSTTSYATPLTIAQMQALQASPTLATLQGYLASSAPSQCTLTIYNANEQPVAEVMPEDFYDSSLEQYTRGGSVAITTYDAAGNATATTQYANPLTDAQIQALGSSPTLAALQAVLTPSPYDQTTLTIYNANELPVATVSSEGRVTVTSYDTAGNVTASTQYANVLSSAQLAALGSSPTLAQVQADLVPSSSDQTTLTVYDSQERPVAVITPNRYVTLTSYDATGNIVVTTEYAVRLTAAQMNALGTAPTLAQVQADLTPSANNKISLSIYDPASNREATVRTNGKVIVTTYDSSGNAIATVNYANLLTSAQIAALAANPSMSALQAELTPSSSDIISQPSALYDANGNVVATIAANGVATTTEYDANGNITASTQYAMPLTWGQMEALAASPTLATLQASLSPSSDDRTSLTIYDANGDVIATVAPDGTVETSTYDAAGNQMSATQYATHLTAAQIAGLGTAPTLAELQNVLTPSTADRTSLAIYDSNGQVTATVTAGGIVTLTNYDAAGNAVGTASYAAALSQAQIAELGTAPTLAMLQVDLGIDSGASESQTIYNPTGQPVATISPSGQVTTTAYDASGNITAATQYAKPLPAGHGYIATLSGLLSILQPSANDITTRTVYDADNRPIATIASNGQVTLTTYSTDGSVATTTTYATALTGAQMASLGDAPTMAQLETLVDPTARVIYNAVGEPVATINAEGDAKYDFYNDAGELAGTVDADGAVTAYAHDADGNLTQTAQYATLISTAGWLDSSGDLSASFPSSLPVPPASASDRTTTKVYDSVGEVVATIDPEGNVTTTTYNAMGDALSTTAYATPLTAAQLAALGSAPTLAAVQADIVASASDRTTVTIYDADGNAVATIDPSGYVTVDSYDADGNIVLQTAYATALTVAQRAALGTSPSLAALQADISTSAQDQTTRNYYNGQKQLVAQVDADGYLTVNTYNEAANKTSSTRYGVALTAAQLAALTGNESVSALKKLLGTNPASETTSSTYDAGGRLIRSVAADGTITAYTYDADGDLLSTTVKPVAGQGKARTTRATYDALGDMLASTDADGHTTTYVYNVLGQRIESTDPLGNSTWYYYDADGQLTYTVQGQPSASGQPNAIGNVTAYAYDAFGDVTSVTAYASQVTLTGDQASSGTLLNPATAGLGDLAAAVAALPASISDANDVTSTTYTTDGQIATTTDGDGYETADTYDAFGDLIQTQQLSQAGQALDAGNSTTTDYAYDARGERTSATDGVGTSAARTTSSTYDAFGRMASTTDGNGNTTTYGYDKLGRQVSSSQIVQGVTRTTQTTYDAYGHVLTQTDALGNVTSYQYDLATHTVIVTTPDGVTMTTVKDAFGDVVSVTDGAGNATRYTYDQDGRLLTSTDALGDVSTNVYNADGDLIRTTDAAGDVVTYTYDANGQVLTRRVDPTGQNQVTTYTYDGEGRQVRVADPLGIVTTYAYDGDGNTLTVAQDAGAGNGKLNLTTTYTYDGEGHVLTTTSAPGTSVATTTQFVYDALGRLTQKIVDPAGLALTTHYVYDADNNVVQTTDPDGNSTYTIYNQADEAVFTITPVGAQGANQGAITQNSYDADGNLVSSHAYANAVDTGSLNALSSGSTGANLAIGAALAGAASTASDAVSYSVYNADGQVIYQIDPLGNVTETRYNALGQVAGTLAYATPITVSSTLANALQAGTAQAADIQAALSSAGDSDASAHVTYTYYDADGRIAYTVTPNLVDGVLGAVVSQTQYDAAGRIVASIVYGTPLPMTDVGAGVTTASIAQALAQTNTAATTRSTQYVYNGAGEQVAQIDPDGNVSYTFYNKDGQVSVTVDATGAVVQYTRDVLGRVVKQTSYAEQVDTSGWLSNGVVTVTAAKAIPTDADPTADRVTVTSYDALGRVSKVTRYSDAQYVYVYNPTTGTPTYRLQYLDGDTLTYTYDAASRVIQTTDVDLNRSTPEGVTRSPTRTTRYFYDADGNTIATLNADGYLTTDSYDAAGNLVQTVAYATAVTAELRAAGTLAQLIPASSLNDQVTTSYYDVQGNRIGTLDADGYFTQYTYDQDHDLLTTTRYATALSLGTASSLESVASALAGAVSHQTTNTYDAYGDVLSTRDYEGTVTQYTYDDLGNVIQTTIAAGTGDARTTGSAYDAFGNLVSTTDGLGNVTTYTYDLAGNQTSMTDALGDTTWYVYDTDNRLAFTIQGMTQDGVQNALGEVSSSAYDAFGDVMETVAYSDLMSLGSGFSPTLGSMQGAVATMAGQGPDPDGTVIYYYDLEGNVSAKIAGDGFQADYAYDGFNELVSKQAYNLTLYTNDAMGNLTSEVVDDITSSSGEGPYDYDGLSTQEWTYDAFGNVVTYTDGDGNTTSYGYDGLDQQLSQSLTVSGQVRETQTSYDAYGRVLSTTDAMGLVTTYSYDDADRSVTVTAPGGVSTTTSYNREGQKIAVTDAAGNTTSYQYDPDGRLIGTTNPDGSTTADQYDAVGNLIESTNADGHVTAYTYDAAGRVLTQTVDPAGLGLVTTYAYDGRGLDVSVTDPTGAVTTYAYDGNGNVSTKVQNAGSAANDLTITTTYFYNELNEIYYAQTSEVVNGSTQYYGDGYDYDVFGRLLDESLDTGGVTNSDFAYDPDGNLIEETDGNSDNTFYFYNEAGQQIYAVTPTGGSDAAMYWQSGYVPPTGAVTQTTYNADGQVVSTTQYAAELSASDIQALQEGEMTAASALASMVATSSDDRTSYQVYNAAGQLQYSIDATGAVVETLYNAAGQVSETLAYANLIGVSPALAGALQAGTATAADVQSALNAAGDRDATARATYTYYDDMGRVSFVISSATLDGQSGGLVQQTQYDADGNVTAQIQYGELIPLSQVGGSATTASVSQYLAGATDMHVTRSVYDAAGRKVYTIDAANNVTEKQYDGDGRVTATLQYADPIGSPASWDVADVAAAVQAANAGGDQTRGTENVYDGVGNIVATYSLGSGDTPVLTASYTYDGRGLKLSYTDADGDTWNYAYDSGGNLIQQTSPSVAVASYSSSGAYLGTTQQSIVTTYTYDSNGNRISETDADDTAQASTTQYTYDAAGNLIQTTLPTSNVIDPATGLLVATGAQPTINITYSAFGEAVVSQDADGNDAYNVYDKDGRLAYAIDGDGYVTGYQYDAYGEQTAVTRYAEPVDTSALLSSDSWATGQPLSMELMASILVASDADRTVTMAYDAQGNKISITEPVVTYTNSDGTTAQGAPVTQYTYDAYGNVTSQSVLVQGVPGSSSAVWATTYNYYDAVGNQLMSVDPMGYVTTNTYDAFGDVLSTTQWATAIDTAGLGAGGAAPTDPPPVDTGTTGLDRITQYTYDNRGNKVSESVLRSYDNAQGQSVVGFVTTTYGYDGDNHLTTVTENGNTVTTAYDALGRVTSVTGPQMEVLVSSWQALLEANASLTLASPTLYTLASQVVSYAYDALGNKLAMTEGSTGSSQSVSTYYQYDNAGNLVAQITPLDGSAPDWTSDQAKFMSYDADGNQLSQWYTLTGDDGSTATVTTVNTYDADGQLTASETWRASIPSPDKSTSTTYDAFGAVVASGDGVVDSVVNTYDNDGNLIASNSATTSEVHTYGYNLAGQQVTDTVPLAAAVGGSAQTLYTLDLDGRVVAEQAPSTDAASGENAGILHATYDAWGNVLSSTDANGNTTTYTYNERNDVVTETEAAVTVVDATGSGTTTTPVKTSSYDANGNLIASTDEDKNLTQTFYNALGQKTETIDGTGAVTYTGYDALGNAVASQDGNGNISFTNVDALGRAVQTGEFIATGQGTYQAVWQQAYVLDQNGDRIISYDGIGSADLQSGDTTDAALHASYAGYDSQGHILWSQDAAQRAASTSAAHGLGNYGAGDWTQQPPNSDFSQGTTGWTFDPGYSTGSYSYDGQTWPLMFAATDNPDDGIGSATSLDRVPVVPGQVITASAQFDVLSEHGNGQIFIIWYDANGNVISNSTNSPGVTAGDGPQYTSVTGTAPVGAAYAAISIGCSNYNEGYPGVVCSGVSWSYVPPAYITSTGTGNGGAVVMLPSGNFTGQPTNQDFEQGSTGWTLGTGWNVITDNNTANGTHVANYSGTGIAFLVNQDRVPVTAGQTITASIQVSLYLAADGAQAAGAVLVVWYDANGNQIGVSEGNVVSTDHKGAWKTSTVVATAPTGAAYAALGASASANGIGSANVDAARWNYVYIPQVPTGVVQETYTYDMDGNLVGETTADGDSETWQYNAYGQVTTHTDLSGAVYNYTYDAATGAEIGESDDWSPTAQGQVTPAYVTAPISTPNSETLTYDADGQVATETFSGGSSYTYQYDADGNLVREEDITVDGNGKAIDTVTQTTYDSHDRISSVTETDALTGTVTLTESFSYDAAGNRREVKATSDGSTQDAWYTYDGDNRVAIADGTLTNGQILVTDATGSYANAYDADGNVIQVVTTNAAGDTLAQRNAYNAQNELVESDYAVDVTTGGASQGVQETISYDADGHALVTDTYYALGTTIRAPEADPDDPDGPPSTVDVGGELESATVNFYDAVGRLAEAQTFATPSGWDGTASPIPTGTPDPDATSYGSLTLQSEVVYQGADGTSGYDADGDVVAYQYRDASGRVDQYQVSYLKKDGYLQADTSGSSNTANVQPATDEDVYDTRGNLVALEQHTEDPYGTLADTVHVFATDGNGEIIERQDGTGSSGSTLEQGSDPAKEVQHYVYANGQQLAHYDDAGTVDVLDQVTAFSSNNDSPDSYVVQSGDTLESIAQAEYGNANLWYVIAQANDLASDTDLVLGQRLQIPAVTTHSNTATTFKPYDPSSIVGSTTPNLPTIAPPPPPSSASCNPIAEIIVIAITAVVTYFTAGATSELLASEVGSAFAESAVGTAIAAGVGAAAGNIAGQLTGDAEGIQRGFNWGEVGVAGLSAGLTAGVSQAIGGTETFGTGQVDAQGHNVLNTWGQLVQGATSYAANAGAAELLGQPEHFSWAGLVADSVGNAASGYAGSSRVQQDLGYANPDVNGWQALGARAVGDVTDREVSQLLGDDHVQSWEQIGEDTAGFGLAQYAEQGNQSYQRQATQAYAAMGAEVNGSGELPPIPVAADTPQIQLGPQAPQTSTMASTSYGMGASNDGQTALNTAWAQTQVDMSHVDPQAALELQEEMAAEDMASIGNVTSSDLPAYYNANPMMLPPVNLGSGDASLSASDLDRLATTTTYSGTYVDPYLINRNGGEANWLNTVQTFSLPDEAPTQFTDLTEPSTDAAPPAEQPSQGELAVARGAGALIGVLGFVGKIGYNIYQGGKMFVGAAANDLGSQDPAFRNDADQLGSLVDRGVNFIGKLSSESPQQIFSDASDTVYDTLGAAHEKWEQAMELGQSNNLADNFASGVMIGDITGNVGAAVDGTVGGVRLAAGVGTAAVNGVGQLVDAVGDISFAGSSGGYGALASGSQLGAIGEDLSGVRPVVSAPVDVPVDLSTANGTSGSLGELANPGDVPNAVDTTASAGSDWVKPSGWRLPATNGEWLGTPGNSGWLSYNDDVNAVTGGQPIPFNNGYPDFSQWSQGSFTFSNLTGTNSDFSLVYQTFADENGLANQTAGQNLLRDLELTPHHVEDGQTIQLIPTPLHGNVPHIGGASILRNGN